MEGGPPIFRQDGSCPALLKDCSPGVPYGAVTRSGPPFQALPVPKRTTTGLVRFRSPLLAESRLMSFPPATEMFQFAGFASLAYEFSQGYPGSSPGWVAPFGDPGINDRSHLPRAFRSVPRPSSPLSAKASTRCPLSRSIQETRSAAGPLGASPNHVPEPRRAQGQAPLASLLAGNPVAGNPVAGSPPPSSPDDSAQRLSMKTLVRTVHRAGPADRKLAPADSLPGARGPSASVTFANPFHQSISTAPEPRTRETPTGKPRTGKPRTRETPNPRGGTPPARGSRTGAKPCSSPNAVFTKPVHKAGSEHRGTAIKSDLRHPISAVRSPLSGRPSSGEAVPPLERDGEPLERGGEPLESGGERDRTDDLLLAKQALSQLSYTPAPPRLRSQEPGPCFPRRLAPGA